MPEVKRPRLPDDWVEQDGLLYCLACRRELAGEAGLAAASEDLPTDRRLQLKLHARVEFEVLRDPARPNTRIAKACRTSIPAVRKARERLGLPPGP
jgi:hypothetical protein